MANEAGRNECANTATQVDIGNLISLKACIRLQIQRDVGNDGKTGKHHAGRHGVGSQVIGVDQHQAQVGQDTGCRSVIGGGLHMPLQTWQGFQGAQGNHADHEGNGQKGRMPVKSGG